MFLNICFFCPRMRKLLLLLLLKMSLSKFSVVSVFSNMLYRKKGKPRKAGNHFLLCKAENTHG